MRIGITGASGLIGSRLAALARERGHEVIAFSRNPHAPGGRKFLPGQTPDVSGCDAIVNLAAEPVAGIWTQAKKRAIRDSRILGTRSIIEAINHAAHPPRVLVNASAVGYYGDTGENPEDEGAKPSSGFLAGLCADWENEALRANTRVVLLRTGLVLSPRGGALAAMLPIFRLGLGGQLGSGRQWISWVHLDDEAALILAAVENDQFAGPLNSVSPNPVRNSDFTAALAHALRRPAFFRVPAFALRLALGGFSAELLENRRVLPVVADRAGFTFRHPTLPEALAELV